MYQYNDYELLYMIYENDDYALDIMFLKYIPLIKTRIKSFRIKSWNYEDFLQEGLLILNKAIQTYRMDSRKTFNKYFDLILQRRFFQILRKESSHFYNVDLVGSGELLMENIASYDRKYDEDADEDIIKSCRFSDFESKVISLRRRGSKIKDIAEYLQCSVKQVYDANDRIKKKMKGIKISLDKSR